MPKNLSKWFDEKIKNKFIGKGQRVARNLKLFVISAREIKFSKKKKGNEFKKQNEGELTLCVRKR